MNSISVTWNGIYFEGGCNSLIGGASALLFSPSRLSYAHFLNKLTRYRILLREIKPSSQLTMTLSHTISINETVVKLGSVDQIGLMMMMM